MAQPNSSLKSLSDVTQEQFQEIAAHLDQVPLCALVDSDGSDSTWDEYWRKLIKRLAKLDKKYTDLSGKSYIRSLEKQACELKSPSLKLLAILRSRGLHLDVFRSCLEHKEVYCIGALNVFKNGTQAPAIVTQPDDCDLDFGSELKLICKAQCSYPLQYQWFKGQEPLAMSNTSTWSVQHVDVSHSGQYTCRVRNPSIADPKRAFVFSRTAQVTIHPPPGAPIQETIQPLEQPITVLPLITTQPKSTNAQYGSAATLSFRADGLPDQVITYEWCKGESKVCSDNSGDLNIAEVTCEDEGQYRCVASCRGNKVESERVDLHVELDEADHIEITKPPEDVQARVNSTITLKCEARNKSGKELVYEWFRDSKKGPCGIGPEWTLHLVYNRYTVLKYYCRVSLKGCNGKFVKSKYATVTVDVVWFTTEPEEINGYVGEPAILYCKAVGLPEKKISYVWFKSSTLGGPLTPLDCTHHLLFIESLKDSDCGYYTCQAQEDSQFIKLKPVSVMAKLRDDNEEKTPPVIRFIQQPRSRAVEEGKRFSLVCKAISSSGGVLYQWCKEGRVLPEECKEILERVATSDSFGTYYCVVKTTNAYGCALSISARVTEPYREPVQISTTGVQTLEAERSFMLKTGGHFAQEKVALLIGNGHYTCKDMEVLKAVESDIRNLRTTLIALEFKVISLVDLKYDEMIKALEQFYQHLQSGVYAVFYYSGHGFSNNSVTYLMPTDAKKNPLDCISSRKIKFDIQEKCAIGIALLDCCQVSDKRVLPSPSLDKDVNSSTYLELSACQIGFSAFADSSGSFFNKALIECLEEKVQMHDLDHAILTKTKKYSQRVQRSGTIIHKEITLHEPILLSNEDSEENLNSLSQQYSNANYVSYPIKLNIAEESCVQLVLSFSAEFSNVLKVQIRPLAGNNISVTSVVIDEEFMRGQNVEASSNETSNGTFSFTIKSIQRATWPLKLCMKVTATIDGIKQSFTPVHQITDKILFASLI